MSAITVLLVWAYLAGCLAVAFVAFTLVRNPRYGRVILSVIAWPIFVTLVLILVVLPDRMTWRFRDR